MFHKSYKTQLIVNNRQATLLAQHAGCARWAYNWALSKKKESFDKKEKIPSAYDLDKEFNALKKTEIPWMTEVASRAPRYAIQDCHVAFENFFCRCKDKNVKKKGFPKFKAKKSSKQSFKLNGYIHIYSDSIKLPNIGILKISQKNYIPTNYKIKYATVSLKAGKWFVSVNVESPDLVPTVPKNEVVGVDLGSKTLATCSDGISYANPKALASNLKKLKRKSRQFSRKKAGSKNMEKARKKLAKLYFRIANIRKDALHKATTKIINENQVIVLEDLSVTDMLKNRKMSRANSDVGYYEFRRQIQYKAIWNKREVVFVDQFYPSSKLCSCCGWKDKKLQMGDDFNCKSCGSQMDRDVNASLNLKQYYLKQNTASSVGIQACGEWSSLLSETVQVSCSLNQEFNGKLWMTTTAKFRKFKRTDSSGPLF